MKKTELLVGIISLLVIIGLLGLATSRERAGTESSDEPANSSAYETKYATMGAVEVQVKPIDLFKYEVVLNTHSVDFDLNFPEIFELKDDKGNTAKPNEWTGGHGGHHLEGEIIFPPLSTDVKSVTLVIDSIDGNVQSFSWLKEE